MIWFFRSGEWYGSFDPEERGLRFRGGWLSFTPMKEVVILFNEGCYFRSRGNYWKCLVDHLWGHWICKDMLAKIKAWPGCQTHALWFCGHWPYLDWICNISVRHKKKQIRTWVSHPGPSIMDENRMTMTCKENLELDSLHFPYQPCCMNLWCWRCLVLGHTLYKLQEVDWAFAEDCFDLDHLWFFW